MEIYNVLLTKQFGSHKINICTQKCFAKKKKGFQDLKKKKKSIIGD